VLVAAVVAGVAAASGGAFPDGVGAVVRRLPVWAATVGLLGAAAFRARAVRSRVFAPALALLVTADLFSFRGQISSLHDPRIYTARPSSLEFVAHQPAGFRTLTLGQAEDPEEIKACLAPDIASVFGIESVNGFDSLMLKQVDEASGGVMPTYGMIS